MVNIAIIGCGSIAENRHIPCCINNERINLVGVYNRTEERACNIAQKYRVRYYKKLDDVMEDQNVDAVIICTVTKLHSEITIKALAAGKHVLCEKPMAATASEAREMVDMARKCRKKLMISQNQRLYKPHIKTLELIKSGTIGRVLTFRTALGITGPEYSSVNRTQNNWYFNKEAAGCRGVVSDVGSHRVDLMCYYFGEPSRVFAYTPTLDKRYSDGRLIDLDDNAFGIIEFKNGVVGSLITSWTSYNGNDRTTQIYGTEGVITTYAGDDDILLETRSGEIIRYRFSDHGPQSQIILTDIDDLFAQSIEEDSEPIITGEDGLISIKVVEAMVNSNQQGTWVSVS